jgi:hypothetical protein
MLEKPKQQLGLASISILDNGNKNYSAFTLAGYDLLITDHDMPWRSSLYLHHASTVAPRGVTRECPCRVPTCMFSKEIYQKKNVIAT